MQGRTAHGVRRTSSGESLHRANVPEFETNCRSRARMGQLSVAVLTGHDNFDCYFFLQQVRTL
jgi:hypothetical protein